ncbi:hypothetical protein HAX54_014698, partial [Datura stramonium]|nr:hypothetical protein [Datura stramonium]
MQLQRQLWQMPGQRCGISALHRHSTGHDPRSADEMRVLGNGLKPHILTYASIGVLLGLTGGSQENRCLEYLSAFLPIQAKVTSPFSQFTILHAAVDRGSWVAICVPPVGHNSHLSSQ